MMSLAKRRYRIAERDAIIMATFTAKEIASACNTNGKAFRRYIRSQAASDAPIVSACGQGSRYSFDENEAHALIAGFAAWAESKGRSTSERSVEDVREALGL